MRRFYAATAARGFRVKDAVVSYSLSGGYLKSRQRWVCECVGYTLQYPENGAGLAPDRFRSLQNCESLLGSNAFAEVVATTSAQSSDPAFMLYHAEGQFGL